MRYPRTDLFQRLIFSPSLLTTTNWIQFLKGKKRTGVYLGWSNQTQAHRIAELARLHADHRSFDLSALQA